MNQTTIFWPMIAQVALVYAMYGVLWSRRRRAVREGTTRPNQFKDRTAEPDISISAANNILNQFELPVLFYAVCLALYVTNGVSYVALVFAWLFVAARIVHAVIHVTMNRVRYRSPAFLAGVIMLGLMWIWFAAHIAGAV